MRLPSGFVRLVPQIVTRWFDNGNGNVFPDRSQDENAKENPLMMAIISRMIRTIVLSMLRSL
jgi:hypothetical protein